ncbi:MAG: molybdenum cofactor guanylyltransferase, partial [Planctomycetota bacterium]|jgi:molybdopterin-guanine dinucleotide biosynthesis protein A
VTTPLVALLAGGRSTRMGRDKALLAHDDGHTWLEHGLRCASDAGLPAVVVGRQPGANDRWQGISDDQPGLGPLGGLASVLRQRQREVLLVAVDMPLLTTSALTWLSTVPMATAAHGLVTCHAKRIEPCFARYRPSLLPLINEHLAGKRRSLMGLIDAADLATITVPSDLAPCLTNINRPEELEHL